MMKKLRLIITAVVLALVCALGLVACNKNPAPEPSEPVTVTLNRTTLDIERHEEFTLTAKVNNGSGTVYWSVDGTAVVCTDGVVRGVSAGTATVTAKCGDASAACTINVTDTGDVPLLTVDRTQLQIQPDMSLAVTAQTTYKGKPVTTGALTWESGNTELITVTPVAGTNAADIKAVGRGAGKTYVTVSGSYNGVDVSERIEVEIVYDVVVEIDELTLSNGVYSAELITSTEVEGADLTTLTSNIAITASVYESGVKNDSADIHWSSLDEGVAKYEENKIVAKGFGKTTITASYSAADGIEYRAEIDVTVVRPTVRLTNAADVEKSGSNAFKLTLGADLLSGDTISSVKLGADELFVSAAGKNITLNGDMLSTVAFGDNTVTVISNTVEYKQPILVITRKISDKKTLNEVFHPDGGVKQAALDGYYVLGNDIEYNAKWETIGKYVNGDWTLKFGGTLDGRGHAIKGVTVDSADSGLFAATLPSGVIKNIVFTDAVLGGSGSNVSYGGFISMRHYGTISDVYWQGKIEKLGVIWDGTYFSAPLVMFNYGTVKNCFTDVTVGGDVVNGCGAVGRNEGGSTKNVYSLGLVSAESAVTGHADAAAFVVANPEFSLDGWNTDMWKLEGKMPLPKKGVTVPSVTLDITNEGSSVPQGEDTAITTSMPQYTVLSVKTAVDGVTLDGKTLKVGSSVKAGAQITIVAQSVFGNAVQTEKTFTVVGGQTLTETNVADVEIYGTANKTVTLSEANKAAVRGTLKSVAVKNGDTLSGCSYDNGALKLGGFDLLTGETEFVAIFEEKSGDTVTYVTTVNFKAIVVTRIISDKATLDEVFHPESGTADLSGYYVLGDNIEYNDVWQNVGGNPDSGTPFSGTFDGRGFDIKGVIVGGGDSGFFTRITGTFKNVVFTNAVFGGETIVDHFGGFITLNNYGTIKNIYWKGVMKNYGVDWGGDCVAAVIAARHAYDATISDCFVYVENVESMKNYCGGVGKNYDSVNISNVVVVGVTGIADTSGTKNGEYASVEAFKTANPDFSLDSWDNDFWALQDGVPVPKKLAAAN